MILSENLNEEKKYLNKSSSNKEIVNGLENGLLNIETKIKDSLEKSSKRPQVVFINGYAGSGKTYASENIVKSLNSNNIKSIFIETDNYNNEGKEIFTDEDGFNQKESWENGEEFEYYNPLSNKLEKTVNPDIIIIGGIGADKNKLQIDSIGDVFIDNPFLSRLENKGLRDYIINFNEDFGDIEKFMDDICGLNDGGTLEHLLDQEIKLKKFKNSSSLIIENELKDKQASIIFEDGKIIFEAEYDGEKYSSERNIPINRMMLIEKIIGINQPKLAHKFNKINMDNLREIELKRSEELSNLIKNFDIDGVKTYLPLPEEQNEHCDCGLLSIEMILKSYNKNIGLEDIRKDFKDVIGFEKSKGGFTYPGHICKYIKSKNIEVEYYTTIDWKEGEEGFEDSTLKGLLKESSIIRGELDKLSDSAKYLENTPGIINNKKIDINLIKEFLKKGKKVIAFVGGDHALAITGVDNNVYINNPYINNSDQAINGVIDTVKNVKFDSNDDRRQQIPIEEFEGWLHNWPGDKNKTEIIIIG